MIKLNTIGLRTKGPIVGCLVGLGLRFPKKKTPQVSLTNVITLAWGGVLGFKSPKGTQREKVVCFLSTQHPSSLSFSFSFLGVS
jgi:hypothetical protein